MRNKVFPAERCIAPAHVSDTGAEAPVPKVMVDSGRSSARIEPAEPQYGVTMLREVLGAGVAAQIERPRADLGSGAVLAYAKHRSAHRAADQVADLRPGLRHHLTARKHAGQTTPD